MKLELNSDNIDTILVNLSCCIDDLSVKLLLFASTGNKKCFQETNEKIITLSSIYDILKDYYQITYPAYGVSLISLGPK